MTGIRHALFAAAAIVSRNQLSSTEWTASLRYFDVLRMAEHPAVLDVAAEIRDADISHEELANLLRQRAQEF